MLTFAITTFFGLALCGALSVIALMIFGYRAKITRVIFTELQSRDFQETITPTRYRYRTVKPRPMAQRNRVFQPVPLRAAA